MLSRATWVKASRLVTIRFLPAANFVGAKVIRWLALISSCRA